MGHVFSLSNLIKAYRYLKKNGAAAAFSAVQERILQDGKNDWKYQRPDRETLEAQRKDAIASFEAIASSEAATSLDTMASSETMVSSETRRFFRTCRFGGRERCTCSVQHCRAGF